MEGVQEFSRLVLMFDPILSHHFGCTRHVVHQAKRGHLPSHSLTNLFMDLFKSLKEKFTERHGSHHETGSAPPEWAPAPEASVNTFDNSRTF